MRIRVSVANLIGVALLAVLCMVIGSWVVGVLIPCLQAAMLALIVFVGAIFVNRWLATRSAPASRQVVDQPPAPDASTPDAERVARQIEARRNRLERGE